MILHISELPPPLSACFNNAKGRGRVKTKRYNDWIHLASGELWVQDGMPVTNPIAVTYRLVRPDNRKRDLDNMSKALGDILVGCGIIKDDSLIHDLRLVWVKSENAVSIHIKDL